MIWPLLLAMLAVYVVFYWLWGVQAMAMLWGASMALAGATILGALGLRWWEERQDREDRKMLDLRQVELRKVGLEWRALFKPLGPLPCDYCGRSIRDPASTQRYCSARCRAAAWRARRAA